MHPVLAAMASMAVTQVDHTAHIQPYPTLGLDGAHVDLAEQATAHQHQLAWSHRLLNPLQHLSVHLGVVGVRTLCATPKRILPRQRQEGHAAVAQGRRQRRADHGVDPIKRRALDCTMPQQLQMLMPATG